MMTELGLDPLLWGTRYPVRQLYNPTAAVVQPQLRKEKVRVFVGQTLASENDAGCVFAGADAWAENLGGRR